MKKVIIISSVAIALTIGACNQSSTKDETNSTAQQYSIDTTRLSTGDAFYTCPMHLDVILDKPGKCPKCGMDLEKKGKH